MILLSVMIGFYIIVRFMEIYQTNKTKSLQGFSVLGIILTIFLLFGIIASGVTMPKY